MATKARYNTAAGPSRKGFFLGNVYWAKRQIWNSSRVFLFSLPLFSFFPFVRHICHFCLFSSPFKIALSPFPLSFPAQRPFVALIFYPEKRERKNEDISFSRHMGEESDLEDFFFKIKRRLKTNPSTDCFCRL